MVGDGGVSGFDPEAVHAKYLAERDKRLVPGRADIRDLSRDEHFARFREDPFTPRRRAGAGHRRRRRGDRGRRDRRRCSPAPSCARPASSGSASSTRPAASAAPGTGTATRA